jgi:hypothetical protein
MTWRRWPSATCHQVAGYMSMVEAEHGDQVIIHMRPERWLSADLGLRPST